jgi:hypothetical protein
MQGREYNKQTVKSLTWKLSISSYIDFFLKKKKKKNYLFIYLFFWSENYDEYALR